MSPQVTQSVLVYDRIAQNRRKTVILVLFAILSVIPFVAGASYAAAEWLAPHREHSYRTSIDRQRRLEEMLSQYPSEYGQASQAAVRQQRKALEREMAADAAYRPRIMAVVGLGLTALLALLFWSVASSPVSKMLGLCGARPAGKSEQPANRLLENLAIGAGLPAPKLYVIDSLVPNAFAAGMDPSCSIVAVTVGLLQLLDHRELEGVLAHEISHIGNRDTRMNTIVTSIALFLRLPYLWKKRQGLGDRVTMRRGFRYYSLMLIPIYIYIFLVAPILAAIIRAAISRGREYLADADAALLTRYPEGLVRALAKIGGCGSAITGSNPVISHLYFADPASGRFLATHPPLSQRIERLAEFSSGVVTAAIVEEAVHAGQDFARDHPPVANLGLPDAVTQDELSFLTVGNPMGRAHRLLGTETLPVYDRADVHSMVLDHVAPDELLVVFDDPGAFRQVNTARQTFGYLSRAAKLQPVDILPAEVYEGSSHRKSEFLQSAPAALPAVVASGGLTGAQIAIATGFGVLVFGGILLALMKLG